MIRKLPRIITCKKQASIINNMISNVFIEVQVDGEKSKKNMANPNILNQSNWFLFYTCQTFKKRLRRNVSNLATLTSRTNQMITEIPREHLIKTSSNWIIFLMYSNTREYCSTPSQTEICIEARSAPATVNCHCAKTTATPLRGSSLENPNEGVRTAAIEQF